MNKMSNPKPANTPFVSGTAEEIMEALKPHLGEPRLNTRRAVGENEIIDAIDFSKVAKKHVRIYSRDGFVPNSYKYACWIQAVDGNKRPDGEWEFRLMWTGAQRSHGAGKLQVVQ